MKKKEHFARTHRNLKCKELKIEKHNTWKLKLRTFLGKQVLIYTYLAAFLTCRANFRFSSIWSNNSRSKEDARLKSYRRVHPITQWWRHGLTESGSRFRLSLWLIPELDMDQDLDYTPKIETNKKNSNFLKVRLAFLDPLTGRINLPD